MVDSHKESVMKIKLYMLIAIVAFSASMFSTADASSRFRIAQQTVDALCYLKAEDTSISYHLYAKKVGLSRHTLKKAEQKIMCNDVLLGQVASQWLVRQQQANNDGILIAKQPN